MLGVRQEDFTQMVAMEKFSKALTKSTFWKKP